MTKAITTITAPAIARGTDKISHETYYVCQSNTAPNTWYQQRWSNARSMWQCNCPAGAHGRPCCHLAAVQEVLKIRRATIALAMGGETPRVVAELQAREDRKLSREAYVQEFSLYE